uniref:Putative secreted peptide n=1 Tax=Anopheles braziliensis TaxID=58242 RepID=A0A2M3ZX84_9DIPT
MMGGSGFLLLLLLLRVGAVITGIEFSTFSLVNALSAPAAACHLSGALSRLSLIRSQEKGSPPYTLRDKLVWSR